MRLNFKRAGLLCARAARGCAKNLGLTVARLDVVAILLRNEMAQVEIAAILCVTEPVVSLLVRVLEEQGWVQRRPKPGDKRVKLCSLTDEGRARIEPRLNDLIWVDPDGQFGAQCVGEAHWMGCDWEYEMNRIGIDFGTFLSIESTTLMMFRALQTWNKRNDYKHYYTEGGHPLRKPQPHEYVQAERYRPRHGTSFAPRA